MTTSRYTDRTLLLRMAAGEEDAFNQLFNNYWDKVYSTALVLTKSNQIAEDIAQEVFLRMWQNRHKTDIIDNLDGFLFITARNLVYNKLSRLKLEAAYTNYLQHHFSLSEPDTETGTEFRQLQSILEEGMRQLPPQQQKAFRLSRENGLSHEEISHQMGVSRATVKDYIVRAIAFLRKYLQEHALGLFLLILSRLK
ncbi:RNA polymerase sigma factor [Chitinophaga filiformis]|uniref:RNA polymerase sigma-70 factor, ECF subfamily n=1 Tax=Chitinophaga filiformis TaxID=104663 RepID=A0A1G7M4V2_CHIFI|nr:RNA polymerase sigma-70 factor [Chitinophaga filiformis]SDF56711.1 RNA polymerase sigma-70 factor, ECF subfamily [Chitinophaga filiformis]